MVAYTYYSRDSRVRREAEALVEFGNNVEVVALREPAMPPRSTGRGVKVIQLPLKRRRNTPFGYIFGYISFVLLAAVYVSILHIQRRFDIIHVHNMPDFVVICGAFPKLLGARLLLDVHDPMPELFSSIYGNRLNIGLKRLLLVQERVSHRFADRIITVSQGMRELLISRGVPPDKLDVVMNLPDPSIFGHASAVSNKASDGFTMVYAGTISPRHRLDLAIKAVRILHPEMPDLNLRIIGDGPDLPRLKKLAEIHHVKDQVAFEGAVPLERIPEFLAKSDAGVSPHEADAFGNLAFPTKVVEALTVGLPVVSARTPTMLRYFDDSILYYFEPGDVHSLANQLRIVRSDNRLAVEKVTNARKLLANLNWESEKEKLASIYARVLVE